MTNSNSSNFVFDYQSITGNRTYNGYHVPIDEKDTHDLFLNRNAYPLQIGFMRPYCSE